MSNSELYHSSVYYGLDVSDGLRHYKYIRRYKKNGRWMYVYKDGSSTDSAYSRKLSGRKYVNGTPVDYSKEYYTNTNQLFDTRRVTTFGDSSHKTERDVTTYGKLHVTRRNLERKIDEISSEAINKGKKFFNKLFF